MPKVIWEMENKEDVPAGCSFIFTIFSLAIVAIPLYIILSFFFEVYQFFLKPNILARSLEMFGALVLIFGAGSLLMWLILILPPPRPPWEEEDLYSDTSKWYEKLWMSPIIMFGLCLFAIVPLFIPIVAFYVDFIAPRLKQDASQHNEGQ